MALTLSGTNGVVGAGFTVDASGVSVTAGVGTFGSLAAPAAGLTGALPAISAASLTQIPAANIVGVCTSGLTKTGGFGKILQIGYGFRTGHLQTSSSSYVDSGITTSITPASTSNRILIQINYLGGVNGGSTGGQEHQVRILRTVGGTDVEIFTERTADFMRFMVGNAQADYMIAGQLLQNLDYPSTTSEITYKLQCRRSGTGTLAVWAGSNISVMEVTP
tara:strand:- start:396 stop:1055 length:660 start_codon:yes stop_codon:yes gene_type:complete